MPKHSVMKCTLSWLAHKPNFPNTSQQPPIIQPDIMPSCTPTSLSDGGCACVHYDSHGCWWSKVIDEHTDIEIISNTVRCCLRLEASQTKCKYHAKFPVNRPSHIGEQGADMQIVQKKCWKWLLCLSCLHVVFGNRMHSPSCQSWLNHFQRLTLPFNSL